MKTCTRCRIPQLESEFSRQPRAADGLQYYCKTCVRTRVREWRERDPKHALSLKRAAAKRRYRHKPKRTHCKRNHEFTPENTVVYQQGRQCLTCYRIRNAARRAVCPIEEVDPVLLAERDHWICGICEEPIRPALIYPDPGYLSIDHIIPLSLGGVHSYENTRASHLLCNTKRGARV